MKKRTFKIVQSTAHKNNKNAFWLLVSVAGQAFSIQTPDWEDENVEIDWKNNTLTLLGEIERVEIERVNEDGEVKKGIKLCPKLDF